MSSATLFSVLNGKVKLSTRASAVHPYPTLGEINKRVAGAFFSPKVFSERMKKGLSRTQKEP